MTRRQQADDLAGVIAALGLQKPAMLGHSMGAATALVLAGTAPRRTRRDSSGRPARLVDRLVRQ